jgi:hypothetical protein
VTAEDELVLLCLRSPACDDYRLSRVLESATLDWGQILQTCVGNKILITVADRLASQPALPLDIGLTLAAMKVRNQVQTARTAEAFETVLPFLVKNGDILLLKGIAYWYTIYKDRRLRHIGDIDVLVRSPAFSIRGRLTDHYPVPLEITSRLADLVIEFHHDFNMLGGFRVAELSMNGLHERRRGFDIAGFPVGLLSPEDDLLYVAYHNAREGFCGLYRFLDLKVMIQSYPIRWEAVVERARKWRLSRVVWLNARALHLVFAETLPVDVLSALEPGRFMRFILLRWFGLELLLHDPNPQLHTVHSGIARNCRKQLLIFLVLVNWRNWHKLILGRLVVGLMRLYGNLIKIPWMGAWLKAARSQFPQ